MGIWSERISRHIWQRIPAIDRPADYRNTIFLAGTGRSGTTWLSNRINQHNQFRYLFEPFQPHYVNAAKPFGYRQYLAPDANNPILFEAAKQILEGKTQAKWVNQYNRRLFSKQRLVKDIRANLFLSWLRKQFPEMPIVMLLRHPLAVAASKRKLNWDAPLQEILDQPELIEKHLQPFVADIERAAQNPSSFEAMIWLWAVETLVPLRELQEGDAHVMYYEAMVAHPKESLSGLFSFLNLPYTPPDEEMLRKPSQTTRRDSAVRKSPESMLASWQQYITPEEVAVCEDILHKTGLNALYTKDSMPQASAQSLLKLFTL